MRPPSYVGGTDVDAIQHLAVMKAHMRFVGVGEASAERRLPVCAQDAEMAQSKILEVVGRLPEERYSRKSIGRVLSSAMKPPAPQWFGKIERNRGDEGAAPVEQRTSAASSAPRSPPSSAAMAPSRAMRGSSAPRGSRLRASVISAEVSVPVLSVHSTVMAPRSWIEARRLTMTLRA